MKEGCALEFATAELRGDHEIVLKAVSHRGEALQYATEELKSDRVIAMRAVTQKGTFVGAAC